MHMAKDDQLSGFLSTQAVDVEPGARAPACEARVH